MKKIIVIGASAASIAFISKLRSFDKESQIICFSGEVNLPYNRCFLADFLTEELSIEQLKLKPQDFFTQNNVELYVNSWVIKIDASNKKVLVEMDPRLREDEEMYKIDVIPGFERESKSLSMENLKKIQLWYSYDYLFLGMGTKPNIPKFMQNLNLKGLYTFHTLHDMQKIKDFIVHGKPKTALVVGAGLNGIEAASSLKQLGLAVGIVEAGQTVLCGQIDHEVAGWISDLMRHQGIGLVTGHRVMQICHQNNKITAMRLDSGSVLSADMVVVAAGSQINSDLAQDIGLACLQGSVMVDDHLKTNLHGVFASGDLCLVRDLVTGELMRSTTWSDAMLQGLCAATNLSATPRAYPGMLRLRDSYFFGKDFYACGITVGYDDQTRVLTKIDAYNVKKLYVKNDQLIGFVLIGDISCLAQFKQLYATGQKIDFEMLKNI